MSTGCCAFGDGGALALGDRLRLRVSHCDPTVNLYDWLWIENDAEEIVEAWPIAARGGAW